ncbi:hypothetical protein LEX80_004581 [Salmonella enterica]|nr:hypothetical protein [Salmonella enterica]EFU2869904.1 hypothetical protein [Salmonella enterica]EIE9117868.1 hypothetical protein [Salmonella enterica]EIE9118092.1 hypothetical protein [Salmonella enterica]
MNKESAFRIITNILYQSDISDKDGYLYAKLPISSDISNDEIISALNIFGYSNYAKCIENGDELYLNRSSDYWPDGDSPLFLDKEQFWQQIHSTELLPDFFFIQSEKISSCDAHPSSLIQSYNVVFLWRRLLKNIADHYQPNRAVIFITTDNSVKKLEIPLLVKSLEIDKIINKKIISQEVSNLNTLVEIKDPHTKERISVLRTAISEITSHANSDENILLEIIRMTSLLVKKYDELYEIYTRRFSVNKLLNELDEKSIEFTSKINEIISSSQGKALTIPGALIAVGALVKSGGLLEAIIIFFGLWLIKTTTVTANDIYRDSLDSLYKRLENAFKKYLKFDEEKEVTETAKEIEADLKLQISNAKKRLKKVDRWAIYMLAVGFIYLSISTLNQSHPDIFIKMINLLKENYNSLLTLLSQKSD